METQTNMLTNESAFVEKPSINVLDIELPNNSNKVSPYSSQQQEPDLFRDALEKDFWTKVKPEYFEIEMTWAVKLMAKKLKTSPIYKYPTFDYENAKRFKDSDLGYYNCGKYEGFVDKDGLRSGFGTCVWEDGSKYAGMWFQN